MSADALVPKADHHWAPSTSPRQLMLPVSLNRFAYAAGNPVTYTDPDGMCANPEFCPAPVSSSKASAKRWYDTGKTLTDPSYGASSGYTAYVSRIYVQRPEIRPPTFRPQFFNRLPNLRRDRGLLDTGFADYSCSGGKWGGNCGVRENVSMVDTLHISLDIVGMAPGIGEFADGLNAVIYGIQGDGANAALYAGSVLVPFASGGAIRAGRELVEVGAEAALRNGDDVAAGASRIHGNSANSPRSAYVYRLETDTGEYLKTGVTQNPNARYPRSFMEDKRMSIIAEGPRREMLDLERYIVERDPGPLNRERWAGRYSGF